jgi:hypothetical protein
MGKSGRIGDKSGLPITDPQPSKLHLRIQPDTKGGPHRNRNRINPDLKLLIRGK